MTPHRFWHKVFDWQHECIQWKHERGNTKFMPQNNHFAMFLDCSNGGTSKFGRTYISAKALSWTYGHQRWMQLWKMVVILSLAIFLANFLMIQSWCRLAEARLKIWQQMCTNHFIEPCQHRGKNLTNLTPGDLLLVETLKNEGPTMSLIHVFIHESL